ncbi:tumor protein p53-inducible nuclear protein 2 isoform X3 [Antennarius striatus]|uniref:tumor protein p53-inducible nuclear protein 2 isoform X3 n=1 Tax=Antennarius striatus TaxID=241820 RepID=UPI0035AE0E80
MFQRLSNLLFGEVEEVAAELKGPNPCVTEADEEGWMLVNLPDNSDHEKVTPPIAQSFSDSNLSNDQNSHTRPECPADIPNVPQKRRRTCKGRARGAVASSHPPSCPNVSLSDLGATSPMTLPRRAKQTTPSSTPSVSPGSEKGATAEASPMEDLLIEHPSMSVYVSSNNLSLVSNGNLSAVGEESIVSLTSSVSSRLAEQTAVSATCTTIPARMSRGAAAQIGPLAKVTQVARVQRSKTRMERRHLSRNRIQRQNLTREQVQRHAAHTRNTFLHQPCKRNICH